MKGGGEIMIDLDALHEDLLKGFILREYQIINPQLTTDFEEEATFKYLRDGVFHNRVDSIVAGVMRILQKHL